jgi:hypothetical protein
MLGDMLLLCRLSDDEAHYTIDLITFYDRNPAGKGLDFGDDPGNREPFLWYSVTLQCRISMKEIARTPLPPLEDIIHGIFVGLRPCDIPTSPLREELERALRKADAYSN